MVSILIYQKHDTGTMCKENEYLFKKLRVIYRENDKEKKL